LTQYKLSSGSRPLDITIYPATGKSPADFILSSIKSDGGYGPYGADLSTYYHDGFGTLAAVQTGSTLPDNIVEKIKSWSPQAHSFPERDNHLMAYLSVIALKSLGITYTEKASYLDSIGGGTSGSTMEPSAGPTMASHYFRVMGLHELGLQPMTSPTIEETIQAVLYGSSQLEPNQNDDGGFERDPVGTTLFEKVDDVHNRSVGFFEQRSSIWRTHHAIRILQVLAPGEHQDVINYGIEYILNSQNSDGGWGYDAGMSSTMRGTWHAIDALIESGVNVPSNVGSFVMSCQQYDGGFGDRVGSFSDLDSTYKACNILDRIGLNPNPTTLLTRGMPSWFNDPSMKLHAFAFQTFGGNYPGSHDFIDFAVLAAAKQGLSVIAGKGGGWSLIDQGNAFAAHYGLPVYCAKGEEGYQFKLQINGYGVRNHAMYPCAHHSQSPWANTKYTPSSSMGTSLDDQRNVNTLCYNSNHQSFLQNSICACPPWGYDFGCDLLDIALDKGGYNSITAGGMYGDPFWSTYPYAGKYLNRIFMAQEYDNHHTFNNGMWHATQHVGLFIAPGRTWSDLIWARNNGAFGVCHDGVICGNPDFVDWVNQNGGYTLPQRLDILVSCITEPISFIWSRYSWEIWQGGLVVSIYGAPIECRVDGTPVTLTTKTAADCASDTGAPEQYMTSYRFAQLPDIGPGDHIVEVDYDGGTETITVNVP